jgi:hypothetical protein
MGQVKLEQILRWRVERQFLGAAKAKTVVDVARRVCGVHAQVASSAAAAVALRMRTAPDLDAALYDERTLVRTWAARGTLHLLPAADLGTWVAAMSTRTRESTGSWLRYNGVTAAQMADIIAAVPDVLGAEPLTREELADAIIAATKHTELRERMTHGFGTILKPLAFRGLLCSGPPRGRNVTFVAPAAWLGGWEPVPADDAIDTLVMAFLGTYGPAGPEEFARWFDLRPPLAKKSFARLADRLTEIDGYGFVPADADLTRATKDTDLLLPAFDPYTVGSLRQLDTVSTGPREAVSRPQGWISPTWVVNGRIQGTWDADGTVTRF